MDRDKNQANRGRTGQNRRLTHPHARESAPVVGCTHDCFYTIAGQVVRFGLARLRFTVRLEVFRRHMSSFHWSCVAPADDRRVFGASRATLRCSLTDTWLPNFFSFSFFSLSCTPYPRAIILFSYILFQSLDRYGFGKVLDRVTSYVWYFFCNFCLTTRRVKSVGSSLTVLKRFSDLHLRIEISAKLLHRSCVELFLCEYINILGLDSHRKSSNLKNVVQNLTTRNVLGSWQSVGLASLLVLVQVSFKGGFQRWFDETSRRLFSVSSQFSL